MCSIIGYYGKDSAAPIMVKGLKRMEYRGYDSVGVATKSDHKIEVRKGVGKVSEVNDSEKLDKLPGNIGIGHTRWATHGVANEENAHPHFDCNRRIADISQKRNFNAIRFRRTRNEIYYGLIIDR